MSSLSCEGLCDKFESGVMIVVGAVKCTAIDSFVPLCPQSSDS